jgi:putative transposase
MPDQEVITRRNLPHWYVPGAAHFVTYRLFQTIPEYVLARLKEQSNQRLRSNVDGLGSWTDRRQRAHKQFFAGMDQYLDTICKRDELGIPAVAAMVRGNLYHHNQSKYHLIAYCIMPNHVHVLLQPIGLTGVNQPMESLDVGECPDTKSALAIIMHSLKSYTAHQANSLLQRSGTFWQSESYDHWVRDDDELERIVEYIAYNPVKAGLVARPHEWLFCSAHDRFLTDGSDAAWLEMPVVASVELRGRGASPVDRSSRGTGGPPVRREHHS